MRISQAILIFPHVLVPMSVPLMLGYKWACLFSKPRGSYVFIFLSLGALMCIFF